MQKFEAESAERLDKFLAERLPVSRGRIQRSIKDGVVAVNGGPVLEADYRLCAGDIVELPEFEDRALATRPDIKLNVVFENDYCLVIDKPAGLVVHPGAGHVDDTLSNALLSHFPAIRGVGDPHRPGIVHRLDEDTSGLLLIAKTQAAYDYFKGQFLDRRVEKDYLALVHGLPKLHGVIDLPIGKSNSHRKMKAGEGKEAVTEYSVLAQSPETALDQLSLLRVKLHTGRTHQIRVHLSHEGFPIFGDQVYGGNYKESDKKTLPRQFLHAYRLKFQLMDGAWIELVSNLPEELKQTLTKAGIEYVHPND
ncbi:MAG: RluA family pseudouridine synthase [Candidatus Saccharibacteria bacterium]